LTRKEKNKQIIKKHIIKIEKWTVCN
jgi:hypothetical protein